MKSPKWKVIVSLCFVVCTAYIIYAGFKNAPTTPEAAEEPARGDDTDIDPSPKPPVPAPSPEPPPPPPEGDRDVWIQGIETFALNYLSSIKRSIEYSARVESVKIAAPLVVVESQMRDVRPDLTAAILLRESGFRFDAKGAKDERGIGQLMGGSSDDPPEVQIIKTVDRINEAFEACPRNPNRHKYSFDNLIPVLAHYSSGKCDRGISAAKRKYKTFLKAMDCVEKAKIIKALGIKNNVRVQL